MSTVETAMKLDTNVLSTIELPQQDFFRQPKIIRATPSSVSVVVENCPRQGDARYGITMPQVPYVQNDAARFGDEVHQAAERALKFNATIPAHLQEKVPVLAERVEFWRSYKGFTTDGVEQDLAVNADGKCGWFQRSMGVKSDLLVHRQDVNGLVYMDWKTNGTHSYKGVYKPPKIDHIQVEMTACTAFIADPALMVVSVVIEFLMHGQRIQCQMRRDSDQYTVTHPDGTVETHHYSLPGKMAEYWYRMREKHFPPKKGGLCKGWCSVQNCEFWQPKG